MPSAKNLAELIDLGIQQDLYQSAVAVVGNFDGEEIFRYSAGPETIYDVGSLTKIFVTGPTICQYLIDAKLANNLTLKEIFPRSTSAFPWIGKLSLKEIFLHRSGLRNWRAFFLVKPKNFENYLENEAFRSFFYEKKDLYSDIGFIIVSHLFRQEQRKTIYEYCAEKVLKDAFGQYFFLSENLKRTVHDDNCRVLSDGKTWCGHAGLFCSKDLPINVLTELYFKTASGKMMVAQDKDGARLAFRSGEDPATRVFGNGGAFGHYGFTGCFFWLDPLAKKVAFLFTDRFQKSFAPTPAWKTHRTKILTLCHELS